MTELILSDITVMGEGYCVIGLEQISPASFRSTRPMPPQGFAWREPFPFRRGDAAQFEPRPTVANRPHVEDQQCNGLCRTYREVSDETLLEDLRQAEIAEQLADLFGCQPQSSDQGGRAIWVKPDEAKRSICGCEYDNLRFRLFPEPEGFNLRAELVLRSNERLSSIPVVDREWRRFVRSLLERIRRSNPLPLAERFLNRKIADRLCFSEHRFVRIGLPRPRADQHCWLMLDSLFPQPQSAWADEL